MTFEARQNIIVTNCYRVPADVACAFQDQIRQHMERAIAKEGHKGANKKRSVILCLRRMGSAGVHTIAGSVRGGSDLVQAILNEMEAAGEAAWHEVKNPVNGKLHKVYWLTEGDQC